MQMLACHRRCFLEAFPADITHVPWGLEHSFSFCVLLRGQSSCRPALLQPFWGAALWQWDILARWQHSPHRRHLLHCLRPPHQVSMEPRFKAFLSRCCWNWHSTRHTSISMNLIVVFAAMLRCQLGPGSQGAHNWHSSLRLSWLEAYNCPPDIACRKPWLDHQPVCTVSARGCHVCSKELLECAALTPNAIIDAQGGQGPTG